MQMLKVGKAIAAISLGAMLFTSSSVFAADKDDAHMKKAMEYLSSARAELEKASAGKGGHRAEALRLIDQAKGEVKAGMAFEPDDKGKDSDSKGKDSDNKGKDSKDEPNKKK